MSRCDSAAMVLKTRELLPEPETPVKTVRRRFGNSTSIPARLFSRAPPTRIMSWLSASCCGTFLLLIRLLSGPSPVGRRSVDLLDAHHIARRIAESTGSHAVGLPGRLLHALDVGRLHLLERAVQILGREHDPPVVAL